MTAAALGRIRTALSEGATELSLADTGLTELPEALSRLSGLRRLDLSYNRLSTVPSWLEQLTDLTELDLNYNRFDAVPDAVLGLRRLRGLGLLGNRLTTLPDGVARLSGLRWLVLGGNPLTTLPDAVQALTRLEMLDLGHIGLTGLPGWIGELTRLTSLELTGNDLTGVPAELGRLDRLVRLYLRDNRLTGLPADLGALVALQRLSLSNNALPRVPAAIAAMSGLAGLALRCNQLTELPDWIGELSELSWLALGGNRLTRVPASIGRLHRLTDLDLGGNALVEVPQALCDVPLERLDLTGNPLSAELRAAYDAGVAELQAYLGLLREDGTFIHEAKLVFVGEGDVGKSCLLGALRAEPWRSRSTTHGIEIKGLYVDAPNVRIRLNGWDFSGQPDYRATHQLFFSAPAVYLVVWKPRVGPEGSYVSYWINLIRHRVGAGARIIVVATHGGPGEPAAFLDEEELQARYGDLIVGFHHVDSRTGQNLDELRRTIAEAAATLPGIGRWYPRSWERFRDRLKEEGRPYLFYPEYEDRAIAFGLTADSAAGLARNADSLGHWINHTDEEDLTGLPQLVILQPDWLAKAISLVLNDRETFDAKGLLPHRRLRFIWSDPGYAPRGGRRLLPMFLALMERFELSYRVPDPTGHIGQTSLIALRMPSRKPDLSAWTGYHPEWPRARRSCEIVAADTGAFELPEGLICRLVVRFHRFSLGRADVRDSVHWKRGMVLDDSYNGRALVELRDGRVHVTVRAVYPHQLLARLTEEIRSVVESHWQGFRVRIKVPCPGCRRDAGQAGLFDVAVLIESRAEEETLRCPSCGRSHRIDDLLVPAGPLPAGPLPAGRGSPVDLRNVVRDAVHGALKPLATAIENNGIRLEELANAWDEASIGLASQRDQIVDELLSALDDEVRNGPWLISVEEVGRSLRHPGLTHVLLRIVLWCEHSRLPLYLLRDDPRAGVYEVSVPRAWLTAVAPYLKVASVLLRTFVPFVPGGLDGVLSDAVRSEIGERLKATEGALEAITAGPGLVTEDAACHSSIERSTRPSAAMLRTIHALLKDQDITFADLEMVRFRDGRHHYRWVDRQFAGHYRRRQPEV